MKSALHKRLQAIEKRLAPSGVDLRIVIQIRALAEALTSDQLQRLKEMVGISGSLEFPPEMAAERDQYVALCDRFSRLLIGKPYAELRGDESSRQYRDGPNAETRR